MNWRDASMRAACPHCRAVFAVSQAQLDARGGLIRCHDCGEVFDATWHLAERPADESGEAGETGEAEPRPDAPPSEARRQARGEPPLPHDAEQYIAPRASPLRLALGGAAALLLLLLFIWQVKGFFIDEYAQHEQYRGHLAAVCRIAGCKLPLRRASARIIMTHTRIDLHPRRPNAMRVTVKLVNEAVFAQPYPNLQLTLTDRNGRVVGRRAFPPDLYLQGRDNLLESGELGVVHFDLARPHGKAVGFVVGIVSRAAS
ncbi:MAG: zinc-ribbon domain-containing protein [Gammaproteobacteria bacterium]